MNKEIEFWSGPFGDEYAQRNDLNPDQLDDMFMGEVGVGYRDLVRVFLQGVPKDARILEVGCNIGNNLVVLRELGFTNVEGIEVNPKMVSLAQARIPGIAVKEGNALSIDAEDNSYDLVFTSTVLIHIAPENVKKALAEIGRVSKKYIWGYEYYAPQTTLVSYRGNEEKLWKDDHARMYKEIFPSLTTEKQVLLQRFDGKEDTMFLLKK